ncbi:MAG: toll/interleukin-1 receptor domain-containing protein [Acidobacteriota bacterium]|nr:MAG: toll/interleukin-1 receptor domain-containing protein [Acidobacteriota bacterium]
MKAWTIDAAKILPSTSAPLDTDDVVTTNRIRMFLERDDINFVVAPKGFGKTLLLIATRMQYHDPSRSGFTLVPSHGLLVDVPKSGAANLDLGKASLRFLSDRHHWESLWRSCLSLAIVRALRHGSASADDSKLLGALGGNERDGGAAAPIPHLNRLLKNEHLTTPLDFMNAILRDCGIRELRALVHEQEYLDELITRLHTPIAIFIDNVDEYFEEHLEKARHEYGPSLRGMFDTTMWYLSQQGLMFAVKTLCRNNHHLDIYASIRKEAYHRLDGTTVENIRGYCLEDIDYSRSKLEEIFSRNVAKTDDRLLTDPALKRERPLEALCGIDVLRHGTVGETERLFDYIYRHTLKRPRDIIRIGRALATLDHEERDERTIRDTINHVATLIALDYIKIVLPHTEFKDEAQLISFLRLIPHNILDSYALRRICAAFADRCEEMGGHTCDELVPFCDLYRLGLLGLVRYDYRTQTAMQVFLAPGDLPGDESLRLPQPESRELDFYLIHPILNALIGGDPRTRINRSVSVGDRRGWQKPLLPKSVLNYKIFLSYSSHDTRFVERLARELNESQISNWFDRRNLLVGDLFFEEIAQGIEQCEYLGVVISKSALESGWVKKEIELAIKHEITKQKVIVLPILIDDVWDQVPAILQDKSYADFRSSYEEGMKQLLARIQD